MNRQQQLLTAVMVVVLLGLVGVLTFVGSRSGGDETAAPAEDTDTPSATPQESQSAAPAPTLPSPAPAPSAPSTQGGSKQRPKPTPKPKDLLGEVPDIRPGGLECIEAISQGRGLTVATFNIHGGFGNGGLNLDDIATEISRMDADVVLLQEVDRGRGRSRRQDQTAILAARTGMKGYYQPAQRKRGGGTIGNAVLTRFPATQVTQLPLPRGGKENRGVMRVQLDLKNIPVAVYVTHLDHGRAAVRNRQIRFITSAVRSDRLPVVLGGDLNATPGSRALGIARSALSDAWLVGRGASRTVPRARIDYLLHDESMTPIYARVFQSRISDHDAVVAGFEINQLPLCDDFQLGDVVEDGPEG